MSGISLAAMTVAIIIPSFLLSAIAVHWVRLAARRLGLLDKPGDRKVHEVPVPLGGGIGIWAGMLGTLTLGTAAVAFIHLSSSSGEVPEFLSWLPEVFLGNVPGLYDKIPEIWVIAGCGTILMLLGLADDRRGIPWWLRLGVEFAVAVFCVYWQGLQLTAYIELPWLTGLLSVVWIVALVNSFNMLDNMDGLSGGVAAISSSMLGLMLLLNSGAAGGQPQLFVAAMLFILVGSLLGFLVHNWPPAKIFMGDAGSYLIGFWIAIATLLATYTGYQGAKQHAVLAPLFVMAIPLYDMLSVIWIRLREGRSPFEADKRHFSHRLVELGMSKKQAVLTIYLATATCSLNALLLPHVDLPGAVLLVVGTILVLALVGVLESVGSSN